MPELPPVELVATLERLGLATAAQMAAMGRRVRRLARDLPRFESVWVDALAQARVLTPFQAAEINAGRAESLRAGPYLLYERLAQPYYAVCYRARHVESQETVRLAVVENAGPRANPIHEKFVGCVKGDLALTPDPSPGTDRRLVRRGEHTAGALHAPYVTPISDAGTDGERIFVAAPWIEGRTAAEWMVHHGRFPPEVALEIARAMLAELIELQKAGICHGDVSTSSLLLTDAGRATLLLPGLRAVLRPAEGYAYADLLPEAYDSLAPERITSGTPPNAASDIYACGCVWWHLLCGRPPLAGGSSLAKLRSAQAAEICDVRRYAPETPAELAGAIAACVQREPSRRPQSMIELAAMIGSPTRTGQEALADCLARSGRPAVRWTTTVRKVRRSNRTPLWIAGSVCALATLIAVVWPLWHGRGVQLAAGDAKGSGFRVQGSGNEERGTNKEELPAPTSSFFLPTSSFAVRTPPSPAAEGSSPVVPAAYQQELKPPPDLVLPGDKPLNAASFELRPGQCVRGPSGRRATLDVPRGGLVVDKENVRFENIDFFWNPTPAATADEEQNVGTPAIVQLLVGNAVFRGCSFQAVGGSDVLPAAIRWVYPAQADEAERSLPTGRIQLTDCLLQNVAMALDCRATGALGIQVSNTLYLGAGAMFRLNHCPASDEAVSIVLAQTTLRGGGPLLECLGPRPDETPGEITVQAVACVLAPKAGSPLLRVYGAESPERWTSCLRWTGQGSLVTPSTPVCTWRKPDGTESALDESLISIAGLVRSEVGFAAEASNNPAASRILRWQAPLQSADPPGVDPAALPSPKGSGKKPAFLTTEH